MVGITGLQMGVSYADMSNVTGDADFPSTSDAPFPSLGDGSIDPRELTRQRTQGRGKADIGGRLRVATILRRAGVASSAPPERIAGSTNEVWRAGDLIIRVGLVAGASRLRREAQLSSYLPWSVRYPAVYACGVEGFGEWLIVRSRPGGPMSEAWRQLERPQRRKLVHEVADAVKALHETVIPAPDLSRLGFDENSLSELPHQMPASRIFQLIDEARSQPWADAGLLAALEERTAAVADAFSSEASPVLVHGDLHFENVLVRNGALVSLLDFEWARLGYREIDLDVLARFCAHPDLTVAGADKVDRDSYRPVLGWFNEAYPEMFAGPRLADRLMLCALAFEVPWLLKMPPTGPAQGLAPYHPVNRCRSLLDQGTEAERLGWVATGI